MKDNYHSHSCKCPTCLAEANEKLRSDYQKLNQDYAVCKSEIKYYTDKLECLRPHASKLGVSLGERLVKGVPNLLEGWVNACRDADEAEERVRKLAAKLTQAEARVSELEAKLAKAEELEGLLRRRVKQLAEDREHSSLHKLIQDLQHRVTKLELAQPYPVPYPVPSYPFVTGPGLSDKPYCAPGATSADSTSEKL
jgi:chromosome segregation ATPase